MSNPGIFSLVTQDDKTDSYFTAYDLLEQRLNNILRTTNSQPTIEDIENTHIVFVKSKYYPYVAVASEYAKAGTTSGVLNRTSTNITFTLPSYGDFTNDLVLHLRLNAVGNKSDYLNNIEPTEQKPLYKYCSYPGIRALELVEFRTGSTLIDSYLPEDVIAYKNFFVSRNHKAGWERCYGQDEVQQATYNSRSFTGVLNYSNGYQTPKLYHETFDMFIPLHLWFCEDVSNALINGMEAASERKINIYYL